MQRFAQSIGFLVIMGMLSACAAPTGGAATAAPTTPVDVQATVNVQVATALAAQPTPPAPTTAPTTAPTSAAPDLEATVAAQVAATIAAQQPTAAPGAAAPNPTSAANNPLAQPTSFAAKDQTASPAATNPDSGGAPVACRNIPSAPAEDGEIRVPSVSSRFSTTGTGFPNSVNDVLLGQFGEEALLAPAPSVTLYPENAPQEVIAEYAGNMLHVSGWQSALSGDYAQTSTGAYVGLLSDGTTDVLITVETPDSLLATLRQLGAPADELAEVEARVNDFQTVSVRYAGKGIVRAACDGAIPAVFS